MFPLSYGFDSGVLLVEETKKLFIGVGARVLIYDLGVPKRICEDAADMGFWHWSRFGGYIVMSAELELACWDIEGNKLWSSFVEPPYDFKFEDGMIKLDVMVRNQSLIFVSGRINKRRPLLLHFFHFKLHLQPLLPVCENLTGMRDFGCLVQCGAEQTG